jgi:hypothetical protein
MVLPADHPSSKAPIAAPPPAQPVAIARANAPTTPTVVGSGGQ